MSTEERSGAAVLATGLAVFVGLVGLTVTHTLDDAIVWALGDELVATLQTGLVTAGGVAALVLLARCRAVGGRATSGRMVSGHAHGANPTIARHEAGHAAAARALGGRVHSATADRHGGYVDATIPNSPRAAITFWLAGRRAAGTGAGCSADDALIRAELRTVPRADRGQMRRDADRDARRIVNQHRSQIRRDARTLTRDGRL